MKNKSSFEEYYLGRFPLEADKMEIDEKSGNYTCSFINGLWESWEPHALSEYETKKINAGWHPESEAPEAFGVYVVCGNSKLHTAYYGSTNGSSHIGWYENDKSSLYVNPTFWIELPK